MYEYLKIWKTIFGFLKHYFSIGVYLQIINLSQIPCPTIVMYALHNQRKYIFSNSEHLNS